MWKNELPWLGEEIVTAKKVQETVANLAARIDADYANKDEVVMIGILRGGFIFLSDLVLKMQLAVDLDFMTVKSYGESTESSGEAELLTDVQVDLENKHVIVVDDILDTGQTFQFLDDILQKRKLASLEYCALFDKPERRSAKFEMVIKYVGMQVPNEFLIGYGLDGTHNKGRNLNNVRTLKK